MSNQIKQEPSSSTMATENPRMVPEEEFNQLKRKLEQNKRKLDQTEGELQKEKEKSKKFKALVATDVQFRPRRETIRLNLPDFAKWVDRPQESFHRSTLLDIAGFHWELLAHHKPKEAWLGLWLYANSPNNYKGPFEFEVDVSLRLFNTFSSKDMHKEAKATINRVYSEDFGGTGFPKFAEIKNLLNPKNGFLKGDGSVQFEADFTVKTATLDHFLVDDPAQNATADDDEGSSTE